MATKLNPGAQAFLNQLRQNVELARQKGTEQVAGLGRANYSWANPDALRILPNTFTAKNLPFSELGVGLSNYGWNEDNIFSKLQDSRKAFRSNQKMGGHQDIYGFMMDQAGTYGDKQQGQLFKQYLETGSIPSGLTMDTVMHHADYGLRANARKQQRKQKGFFVGNNGAIIGAIGGAIIGYVATGFNPAGAVAGAKAGGAAGGVGQAVNEDRGLLGTALAGIGGYGIGSMGATIQSAASATASNVAKQGVIQGLKTSATQGIGSLGRSLVETALHPVQAIQNTFQGIYNDLISPVIQTGRGVASGIGSLANPNMTMGQGFRAGFYGPSSAGIGSLPPPDFATRQVIDASGGSNIIEMPEFSGFGPDSTISGYESAVANPSLGLENVLDQAVYPTNILDPGFVGPHPLNIGADQAVADAISRSTGPISSGVGIPGVDRIHYDIFNPISPDIATQPVMATEQVTGPIRSAGPGTGRPPGTELRMPKVTDGDYGTAEMLRTGQGLGDIRTGYFPPQSSTLPTTTQVGTFNPGALDISSYTNQVLPTQAIAPRFTGVVGDTFASPVTGRHGTIEGDLARAGETLEAVPDRLLNQPVMASDVTANAEALAQANPYLPIPNEAATGVFGVPMTLQAGNVLQNALDQANPEQASDIVLRGLAAEGEGEGRELPEVQGFGQPAGYQQQPGSFRTGNWTSPYDLGALGRRLYGSGLKTLDNPFDLSPYFRSQPVFAEGGEVDTGFPMMGEIPGDMQSKFMKYESGKQSFQSSEGGNEERGYRRMSGTGMEPIEERYSNKPMGLQDFFKRTPEGRFVMA